MDTAPKREDFGVEDTQAQQQALTEDDVIREHRNFVEAQATKLHKQLRLRVDREDLIAYGMVGLIQAWRRYDPSSDAGFISFAFHRVRGAMLDGCRKEGWAPRDRKNANASVNTYQRANSYMEAQHEHNLQLPSSGSFSESVDRVTELVGDVFTIFFIDQADLDTLPAEEGNAQFDAMARDDIQRRLLAAIEQLDESEQRIIKGNHFYEESLTDIADDLGISTSWCSRIHSRALKKLREILMTQDPDTFSDMARGL